MLRHPGSHEEFGPRLVSTVRQTLREADQEQRHQVRASQSQQRGPAGAGPAAHTHTAGGTVSLQRGTGSMPEATSHPHPQGPLPLPLGPAASPRGAGAATAQATQPAAEPPRGADTSTHRAERAPAVERSRWAVLRGCAQLVLWSGMAPRHRGRRHRGRLPDPDAPGSGSGSGTDGLSPGSDRTGAGRDGSDGRSSSSADFPMAEAQGLPQGWRLGPGGMGQIDTSSIASGRAGAGAGQPTYADSASPTPSGLQDEEGDARGLAARLLQCLSGLGRLSGVWVLVAGGGRRALLRSDDEQGEGQETSSGPAVELLRLYPPALALPTRGPRGQGKGESQGKGEGEGQGKGEGQDGSPATGQAGQHEQQQQEEDGGAGVQQGPDGRLSLVLRSPVAQAARLVVLREDPVAVAAGAHACGGLVAAEFPLQLAEGVQEVGVELTGVLQAVAAAGAGAEEDGGEVNEPPAEVLELMLLPPMNIGTSGEEQPQPRAGAAEDGGGGSTAAPPLLHFTVPLLLLPADAAAELRALDGRMREYVQAGQGLAAAEAAAAAGGVGDDVALPAAQGSTRAASPGPPSSGPSDESWGYWGEHMGPLLEDMALVLAGGGISGGGDGEGRSAGCSAVGDSETDDGSVSGTGSTEDVSWALRVLLPRMLAFLREQHMDATARVLSRQPPATPPPPAPAPPRSAQACPTANPTALAPTPGPAPTTAGPSPPAPRPGANPGVAPAPKSPAQPIPASPSLMDLIRGFRGPGLEHQFLMWRAAGLAKAALPLVAAAAVPHVVALAAAARALGEVPLRQLAAAAWWSRVLSAVLLHAASWVGDVGGHLAVLIAVPPEQRQGAAEPKRAPPEPREQEQGHAAGKGVAADRHADGPASAPKPEPAPERSAAAAPIARPASYQERPTASTAAVAPGTHPSLDRVYTIGAMVVGPLLLLLLAAAGLLLQHGVPHPVYAGGGTVAVALAIVRAMVVPCVQQLTARQVVWASPLLVVAEALLLGLLRPEWGRARVMGVAAGWRLVALVLASGFEWRARRRFLRRLAGAGEGGGAAGQCVLAGAVRHVGGKLKAA